MIKFINSSIDKMLDYYMKYTNEVRLVDTYWEDFILESSIFEIHINSKFAGVFSIHNECSRLTSFHVEDEFLRLAHTVFMSVKKNLNLKLHML